MTTLPTFEQLRYPGLIPSKIREQLKTVDINDYNPLNLYRFGWKNDPVTNDFGDVNYIEIPPQLSGVKARIIGLVGKHFPTGAHKVCAAYGVLAPRLVTGTFDPTKHKAVWPSTGNYCRGGVFNSKILGCKSVAILPEEMSRERFEWLDRSGAEIIATPGCESNVKEIYDKCKSLKKEHGDEICIMNQFADFGNGMWHYNVTAYAILDILENLDPKYNLFGFVSSTGSAGTIATGDKLKEVYPSSKIIASEALQCPTMLNNGYGGHHIEGIGDKHIPWIHNVRNTDMICAVDDEQCMALMRLFNEEQGKNCLLQQGLKPQLIEQLPLIGISSICNLVAAIKTARY